MSTRPRSPPPRVNVFMHSTRIEDKLTLEDLAEIMSLFSDGSDEDGLTMQEFCDALRRLPGCSHFSQQALAQLFMKIDTNCNGRVDWDEFCSYMLVSFQERDHKQLSASDHAAAAAPGASSGVEATLSSFVDPSHAVVTPQGHPEQISCLRFLKFDTARPGGAGTGTAASLPRIETMTPARSRPATARLDPNRPTSALSHADHDTHTSLPPPPLHGEFLSVSNDGTVCMWDSAGALRRQFKLHSAADMSARASQPWVADVVVMPNFRKAIVAFVNCTLAVYDITLTTWRKEVNIVSLGFTPLCMDFKVDEEDPTVSWLVIGDDTGSVHSIVFDCKEDKFILSPFEWLKRGVKNKTRSSHSRGGHLYHQQHRHKASVTTDFRYALHSAHSHSDYSTGGSMGGFPLIHDASSPRTPSARVGVLDSVLNSASFAMSLPYASMQAECRTVSFATFTSAPHNTYECISAHDDWCRKVMCTQKPGAFVSCSSSSSSSAAIFNSSTLQANKIVRFHCPSGLACLDYHDGLQVLVGGSNNGVVYVWNPLAPKAPVSTLRGYDRAAVFVAIKPSSSSPFQTNFKDAKVIALYDNATVKLWSMATDACIQTVKVKNTIPADAITTALFQADTAMLAVAWQQHLHVMRLETAKVATGSTNRTHSAPVVGALYNSLFNQIVSCDRDGCVKIFNMDTGEAMAMFTPAHTKSSLSAFTFDNSQRRLITGSTDGTIKIWNFNIGYALHRLSHNKCTEVTGLCELKNGVILASGWFREIWSFRTKSTHYDAKPSIVYSIEGSKEDIQCMVCDHSENMLAIGTVDGVVIFYSTDTMQETQRLNLTEAQMDRQPQPATSSANSTISPVCVNQMLFLTPRQRRRVGLGGSFITADSKGRIMLWNIRSARCLAWFYARPDDSPRANCHAFTDKVPFSSSADTPVRTPSQPQQDRSTDNRLASQPSHPSCHFRDGDDPVTCIAASSDNQVLVAGTAKGYVSVWNIGAFLASPHGNVSATASSTPPLIASWLAHDRELTSVQVICPSETNAASQAMHAMPSTPLSTPLSPRLPGADTSTGRCTVSSAPPSSTFTTQSANSYKQIPVGGQLGLTSSPVLIVSASTDGDVIVWKPDGSCAGLCGDASSWSVC